MKFFTILIVLVCWIMQSCLSTSESEEFAGSGNSTGNVAGLIEDEAAKDSIIIVTLYPSDYSPLDTSTHPVSQTLDSNGKYYFESVPVGHYQLVAYNPDNMEKGLAKDVYVSSSEIAGLVEVSVIHLQRTASLLVSLNHLTASDSGVIYIPGTGIFVKWDDLADTSQVILEGVPAEPIKEILMVEDSGVNGTNFISKEIDLQPDTVIEINESPWLNVQKISLNTSGITFQNDSLLTGFPLLIRISGDNPIFNQSTDGTEFRFAKQDSTYMAHYLEYWDSGNKQAHFWVLMDTILIGTENPFIYIFQPVQGTIHKNQVFHSNYGYESVWSMARNSDSDPVVPELSSTQNHGKIQGTLPKTSVVTPMGTGFEFNGIDNWVSTSDSSWGLDEFTYSIWFKSTSTKGGRLITFSDEKEMETLENFDRSIWIDTLGYIHFGVFTARASTTHRVISSSVKVNNGDWHHVVGVVSQIGQELFVDGKRYSHNPDVTPELVGHLYQGYYNLGFFTKRANAWPYNPKGDYFEGILEDVRVLNTGVSSDWVKLVWEIQSPNLASISIDQ